MNNNTEHFDHPPSTEELMESYLRSEENDPRSLLYKRTLIRPKLPVLRIVLFLLVIVAAGAAIYFGVLHIFHRHALGVICAVTIVLVICVLFSKRLLITLIRIYQAVAPEKLRNRCRYEPSCSVYMIQAIEKYGAWRGLKKGTRRWINCKPPNGGYDLP